MTETLRERLTRRLAAALFRLPAVQRRWARHYRAVGADGVPWTPLARPVAGCRVALVGSGGVHLRDDRPFDMGDPRGDASWRAIPGDAAPTELTITHDYYDHRDADRDVNVVFPLEILRGLQREGRVGAVAPRHYSLMGHIDGPHLDALRRRTAPEVAERLRADGVDAVVLVPS